MRWRVTWATLGFVLVTVLVLWLVAGRGEPWRSAKSPLRHPDHADETRAAPSLDGEAAAAEGAGTEEDAARAPARLLRIRVVTPAGPLRDAEVGIDGEIARAFTGADGVAELGTEHPDVTWVRASKEGFLDVEASVLPGVDEAEIVLVPGVPLRGQVVRAKDGAPVAGALVHAAERASGDEVCRVLTTDKEGRFVVPGLAPGTPFIVAARAEGYFPASKTGLAGTAAADVRVVLGEGATLEGRVRDVDGKGAAAVAIRVIDARDDYILRSFDAVTMGKASLRAAARAATGADGNFTVEGLKPGEYVVLALGASGASAKATFATAGETVRLDLALEPTGSILVRVLDPDGRPVPRARLSIEDSLGKWLHGPRIARATDERGEALSTGLEPGAHDVLVQPERWTAARARAAVERGAPAEVEVHVGRGVSLEGTVRDPVGNPVAGLDIEFQTAGDALNPKQYKSTVTGRDGRFVLDGLLPVPGKLEINDWADRWTTWSAERVAPGGQPLSIVVRAAAGISGRFEPAPPSRRVAHTVVSDERMSGRWELDLDAEGRFVLTGLDEGVPLTVYFEAPGGRLIRCAVGPLAPGERRDVGVLAVAPGRALRGRAVDEDGKPWAFTRVQLSYEDYGIDQYTLTDGNGRFSFDHVDPAAKLSLVVWNAESTGQFFELDDWTEKPVHELVVERPAGR